MSRTSVQLLCVAIYALVCTLVGVWSLRRTHDRRDYFMAGRRLGGWVTGLGVFASTLSGFSFIGGPSLIYRQGFSSMWIVITGPIAHAITFLVVARPLRRIAGEHDALSLPEAVAAHYGDRRTGLWTALVIIAGVLGYLGTQILAMANALQVMLPGTLTLFQSAWIVTAVLLLYCTIGGSVAAAYTDVIQGLLMIVAAIGVSVCASRAFEGGYPAMLETLEADDPGSAGAWGAFGLLGCLGWYLTFTLGSCGQPHAITRLMMTRSLKDLRVAFPLVVIAGMIGGLVWMSVGTTMRALVVSGSIEPLASADQAAPAFLATQAPPLLAGLVFAGLLAASMSTADGFLNIGAAALVHDLPRGLGRNPGLGHVGRARLATVGLCTAAFGIAIAWQDLLGLLGVAAWGLFAAGLVPVIAIGFHWRRATARAARWSLATSLVVNLGLRLSGLGLPHHFDPGALALLTSLVVFVVVSFLARPES
ncbi:MAG: hypothetical protein RL885_22360 [Planctomycetota bacterium]